MSEPDFHAEVTLGLVFFSTLKHSVREILEDALLIKQSRSFWIPGKPKMHHKKDPDNPFSRSEEEPPTRKRFED